VRLRSFLARQNAWRKTDEEQLSAEGQQQIDAAVERYLVVKPRPPRPCSIISMPNCEGLCRAASGTRGND